jgi:hypothetical protein
MEFVGLDPKRVQQLITQMESAKNVLGQTRPGLEADIAEAGPEWTGTQGTTAMHRAWHFFHDAQRDLKWRLDTISRMHPAPAPSGTLKTAQFHFASETEAAQAGKNAAAGIQKLLSEMRVENRHDTWQKIEAALKAAKGPSADPAFATALIKGLGPSGVSEVFQRWKDANAVGRKRGVPPEELARGASTFGVLAQAVANADTSGRLDDTTRKALVETAEVDALTALVALARQSTTFLNQVAKRALSTPPNGTPPDFSDADWNLQALIDAYDANPEALQRLLAEDKTIAASLLHPHRITLNGLPETFEKQLAEVLDKALRPSTGDDSVRAQAWFNLMNGLGYEGSHKVSGHFGSLRDGPINQVLARGVVPYLSQLALIEARRASPNLAEHLKPTHPWESLDPSVAARFIGALMQDSEASKTLLAELPKYGWGLDIGRFQPFEGAVERAEYTHLSARLGGLSALLLGGLSYAELSKEEYAEWAADIALLPIGYAVNKWGNIADAAAATTRDVGLDKLKEDLKKRIKKFFMEESTDEKEEEKELGALANQLIDAQVQIVTTSLELHGQPLTTAEDRDRITQEFRGRLYAPLVEALKNLKD